MTLASVESVRSHRPSLTRTKPVHVGLLALGGLGGSSRVASELGGGLVHHGHRASLLSGRHAFWTQHQPPGVGFVPVPVPDQPGPAQSAWVDPLANALVTAIAEHEIDVLSVHYGVGLVPAALQARRRLAARGRALRVCATLHGTDVTHWGRDPHQGPALAQALGQCDEVTAVSQWLADQAFVGLALPRRPMVIANSVDTELFFPSKVSHPRSPRVLCHASNFRPVKRPLDVLEVTARLRNMGVPVRLVMLGDGPLHAAARRRACELELDALIEWVPPTGPAELARRLRAADLSLLTSASESFSLFALESMASGVPVLGTRCGGLPELLAADSSGELADALLAEVGDIDALVGQAHRVLQSNAMLQRLREKALVVGRDAFARHRQLQTFTEVMMRLTATLPS